MGPHIAAALADPDVIEIMVNPDGVLRIDRWNGSEGVQLLIDDAAPARSA